MLWGSWEPATASKTVRVQEGIQSWRGWSRSEQRDERGKAGIQGQESSDSMRGLLQSKLGSVGASTWLSSVLSLSAAQGGQDRARAFVLYNRGVPFLAPQNNSYSRDNPTDLTCPEAPACNLPTEALLTSAAV